MSLYVAQLVAGLSVLFAYFAVVCFVASGYIRLTNVRWLGAITPIGGLCFLAGWAWLVLAPIARSSISMAVVVTATSKGKPPAEFTGANRTVFVSVRFWRTRWASGSS